MKKYIKTVATALCAAAAVCSLSGLTGCTLFDALFDKRSDSEKVNDLADDLAVELMGNDLFGWNAFAASPKVS